MTISDDYAILYVSNTFLGISNRDNCQWEATDERVGRQLARRSQPLNLKIIH